MVAIREPPRAKVHTLKHVQACVNTDRHIGMLASMHARMHAQTVGYVQCAADRLWRSVGGGLQGYGFVSDSALLRINIHCSICMILAQDLSAAARVSHNTVPLGDRDRGSRVGAFGRRIELDTIARCASLSSAGQ